MFNEYTTTDMLTQKRFFFFVSFWFSINSIEVLKRRFLFSFSITVHGQNGRLRDSIRAIIRRTDVCTTMKLRNHGYLEYGYFLPYPIYSGHFRQRNRTIVGVQKSPEQFERHVAFAHVTRQLCVIASVGLSVKRKR